MDGLRKFIEVDNHEAVNKVVKPKFTAYFPRAIIREGPDELTLRAHGEGAVRTFIDSTNVEDQRWELPLVDADWDAFCQVIDHGIEEQEWEALCFFKNCTWL